MNSMAVKTAVLALVSACSGAAFAKSGEVTITQCGGGDVQTIATSPQYTFGTGRGFSTVRTNPEGGLFDMMAAQCQGAYSSVAGKPSAWGTANGPIKTATKFCCGFLASRA
jgi:hypothetical protein